jgi:hypothetical protein
MAADQRAVVSVDGEPGPELSLSQALHVRLSPHVARFLRLGPPSDFYARVARRLNWARQPGESSLAAHPEGGQLEVAAHETGEGA